ncbi:MAG: glycosyltransferase family 4 protein [Thermoanaerobaculia bacterium]
MRITVLTGPLLPVPAVRGGAMQKSWHGLAREMVHAGHDVTIVARTFPGQEKAETLEGVRFLRTRGFSQSRSVVWDLAKDLAYAANAVPRLPSAEILVTNDFWLPALAARFRRGAGAVVVCAGRYPKGQYWLYRSAARIVAISGPVRAAIMAERPELGARTVVIPLPVDLELFSRARPEKSEGRRLLYAGRVHPEKGLELLIGAFARLGDRFPEWQLDVVGPWTEAEGGGGEVYGQRLRALAQGRRIEFRGPVFAPEALASIYRGADLFCYPSLADRGEAFGVAALESMASGVAPVVSDLTCFRDFVRDSENGWIFDHRGPEAEERLAAALAAAMADTPLRDRVGAAAREDSERFGFTAVAEKYLAEFENVLAEVRGPARG